MAVVQLMMMVLEVLTQVTSHISILPCLKGKTVMLSGQLPSPRSKSHGLRIVTTLDAARGQYAASLRVAQHGKHLGFQWQDKLW